MYDNKYEIIGKIKYNSNKYLILLNSRYQKYYLKIDEENNYDYPTLDEYLELKKLYGFNNKLLGKKTINITPLIKLKNRLIPLTLAYVLLSSIPGCSTNNDTTKLIDSLQDCGITLSDGLFANDGLYVINGLDYSNDKIINYVGSVGDFSYKKICTPGEFSQTMGLGNITWDDIKNVIINSDLINDNLETILLEGVTNLEKNGFDMDLSVLYYNLTNLKFIDFCSDEEINGNLGLFDHYNHGVTINKTCELDKLVIIHEILGHGMINAYCKENEILCGISQGYFVFDEESNLVGSGNLGHSAMEAIADIITHYATGENLSAENANYTADVYSLNTLCGLADISFVDFANNGINYLMKYMKENGIEDPQYVLMVLDSKIRATFLDSVDGFDFSLNDLLVECYRQKIDKMLADGASLDDTTKIVADILTESEKGLETVSLYGDNILGHICTDGAIIVIPDEIKSEVNKNYINLQNSNVK